MVKRALVSLPACAHPPCLGTCSSPFLQVPKALDAAFLEQMRRDMEEQLKHELAAKQRGAALTEEQVKQVRGEGPGWTSLQRCTAWRTCNVVGMPGQFGPVLRLVEGRARQAGRARVVRRRRCTLSSPSLAHPFAPPHAVVCTALCPAAPSAPFRPLPSSPPQLKEEAAIRAKAEATRLEGEKKKAEEEAAKMARKQQKMRAEMDKKALDTEAVRIPGVLCMGDARGKRGRDGVRVCCGG